MSALYGFSRGLIAQAQYSFLVVTVIGSAVIPAIIADMFFLPPGRLGGRAGPL
jgi:glutathione-regulated potassium-efflux system ancillary protein KefC